MATEWKSQQADGMFYLQFETDNKEKYMIVEKAAQMAIDGKTTADYAEVKHGAWIDRCVRAWHCSLCDCDIQKVRKVDGYCYDDMPKYCPACGAKMDGGKKE